ncbi:hypothetical protein [Methanobacterium sp.]|uniref:hypothetical protein n=1 Tax=Methanobacterium sp. TaxID=2164 RepID=UPI002ABC9F32|nr:hypothetical protein [Methanobacterium sp.]MDY9922764.1 hypothetical protein [Methanobacterium sp.]
MDKYLIPESKEEIKNAFILAFSIIENLKKKDILLLTPTKNLMQLQGLVEILGENSVNRLRHNDVVVTKECILRLESLRTFTHSHNNSIIIGIYPSKTMFDKLDDSNADVIIAVPSIITPDVQQWIETWTPKIYSEKIKKMEKEFIGNCVVKKSLEHLTSMLKTRDTHDMMIRSDFGNGITVALFKFLEENNEEFDPISIRKWAVNNSWSSEEADILQDMSQKVFDGRRIRRSIPIWTEEDLKKWREECNE